MLRRRRRKLTDALFRSWMDAYGEAFVRQDAEIEASDAGDATSDYEVIAVTGDVGIARWLATHTYPDKLLRYDGAFVVKLVGGLCREFREWWNVLSYRLSAGLDGVS